MNQQVAIESDYSVLPALIQRHRRVQRSMGLDAKDLAEYRKWRGRVVRKLKQITGFDTMQRCELSPRVTEEVPCDGYMRQRVEIDTEPGVTMPVYVLMPDDRRSDEKRPAVICPHGHGSGGKFAPAGVDDDPEVAAKIAHHQYDYGHRMAQRGAVVFCPDARGFGERQEPSIHRGGQESILTQSCQFINQMAQPLGQTVTGMWAWDLSRLVDYVRTRPECDARRLGCAGLSGGGLQTLWTTALDRRITCAVISGYFYGYEQSLLEMHWNCSCNYVPHLYEHVDMGDLGALIAPRPLLIQSGTLDPLNGRDGLDNVTSQVAITRRAYALHGADDRLVHDVFEGEHRWDKRAAEPWLAEQLGLAG